jgi:hypothetical protein
MVRGYIISLCDLTGHMVQPWVDAGYHAVLVDPQHPKGVHTSEPNAKGGTVTRIGATIVECADVLGSFFRLFPAAPVVFVAGFPPCTDVAVSGARWFSRKAKADKHFQAKAALVAEQCRMVGLLSGAPWLFENPVSVFSAIFGKPSHTFNPYDYTGYEPADNYTKKTCLWTGGGFVMPAPRRDFSLGAPDNRIHTAPPSADRANFRSATPMGFARAVFDANAPHLRAIRTPAFFAAAA